MKKDQSPRGEWELSDQESLRLAISRLQGVMGSQELNIIDRRWRILRKQAMNPATMIGWKY